MATTMNERLRAPAEVRFDLKACPFCGSPPSIQYWHGGRPSKRMIMCSADDCAVSPGVTGETKREAIAVWERRAP